MKGRSLNGAAACLAAMLWAGSAIAQDEQQRINPGGPSGDDAMTNSGGPGAGEGKRRGNTMPEGHALPSDKASLKLSDAQRAAIEQAVADADTGQRPPDHFKAAIGEQIPTAIRPHPLPQDLAAREPVLKQYFYAKLPENILVVDPMSQRIVDIIPRRTAQPAQPPLKPADWAATRGRELLGLPPQPDGPTTTGSGAAPR